LVIFSYSTSFREVVGVALRSFYFNG